MYAIISGFSSQGPTVDRKGLGGEFLFRYQRSPHPQVEGPAPPSAPPLCISIPSMASPSSSFSSILISSPAQMRMVGCQTMIMLSSDVLLAVQLSSAPGAQQKSVGRAVWPVKDHEGVGDTTSALSERTSVNEKELGGTVLLVIGRLLNANL